MNVKWKQNVDSVKLKIAMPGELRNSQKIMYVIIVATIASRDIESNIVLTYDAIVHSSENGGSLSSIQMATCPLGKLSYCPA